jgi:hypothetical protein
MAKDEAVYERLKQRPQTPGFNLRPAGGSEEGHNWHRRPYLRGGPFRGAIRSVDSASFHLEWLHRLRQTPATSKQQMPISSKSKELPQTRRVTVR